MTSDNSLDSLDTLERRQFRRAESQFGPKRVRISDLGINSLVRLRTLNSVYELGVIIPPLNLVAIIGGILRPRSMLAILKGSYLTVANTVPREICTGYQIVFQVKNTPGLTTSLVQAIRITNNSQRAQELIYAAIAQDRGIN